MGNRIGIIPYLFAQPLFYGIRSGGGGPREEHPVDLSFEITEELPPLLARKLRERRLDAAVLSPIDYAKDYAMYSILPHAGVHSRGESGAAIVVFKRGLRRLSTLAVNPAFPSEIVLAHIVFAEKYGGPPTIVPTAGTIEQALNGADAVLRVGDEARSLLGEPQKLDLVGEWEDITGLPFVHGAWITRDNALGDEEIGRILGSARSGEANREHLAGGIDYLNQFQYDMDDDARNGLSEFFRMAYYYGVLPDIPDVRFHALPDRRHANDQQH